MMDNVKKENGTCGCGRSPTGDCIGWHELTPEHMRQKLMLTKRRCLVTQSK